MNKKKSKPEKYQNPETSSVANEPQTEYVIQSNDLFKEDRLYSHEEVFKEFARRLNERIGTNIPL